MRFSTPSGGIANLLIETGGGSRSYSSAISWSDQQTLVQIDADPPSVVSYLPISSDRYLFPNPVTVANHHNAKHPFLYQSRKITFTGSNRQNSRRIIPSNPDDRAQPALVLISIAGILVKVKLAICSFVDTKLDWTTGILVSVFDLRP